MYIRLILLFRFLYCEIQGLNADNVLEVLYAAKKYCVQGLIDSCLSFLKKSMVPENVCIVLESAHTYDDMTLWWKCFDFILENVSEVLKPDNLTNLCPGCLGDILREDDLSMKEEEIFEVVKEYGKMKCRMNGNEATPDNIRNVLGDSLTHIRFPVMGSRYFSESVDSTGILSMEDSLTLNRYFLRKELGLNAPCGNFKTAKRRHRYYDCRFVDLSSGWTYARNKSDAISFQCSRKITLLGIQIYGTCQGSGELKYTLKLKQDANNNEIDEKSERLQCDGIQKTWNILFDKPVTLLEKEWFTAVLTCDGPTTFKGENGQEQIEHENVKFTFRSTNLSTNRTTVFNGQIPVLIYELPSEVETNGTEMDCSESRSTPV